MSWKRDLIESEISYHCTPSPEEHWDQYVGADSPEEFCKGFDTPEAAIADYAENWPFDDCEPTEHIQTMLVRYCYEVEVK